MEQALALQAPHIDLVMFSKAIALLRDCASTRQLGLNPTHDFFFFYPFAQLSILLEGPMETLGPALVSVWFGAVQLDPFSPGNIHTSLPLTYIFQ